MHFWDPVRRFPLRIEHMARKKLSICVFLYAYWELIRKSLHLVERCTMFLVWNHSWKEISSLRICCMTIGKIVVTPLNCSGRLKLYHGWLADCIALYHSISLGALYHFRFRVVLLYQYYLRQQKLIDAKNPWTEFKIEKLLRCGLYHFHYRVVGALTLRIQLLVPKSINCIIWTEAFSMHWEKPVYYVAFQIAV